MNKGRVNEQWFAWHPVFFGYKFHWLCMLERTRSDPTKRWVYITRKQVRLAGTNKRIVVTRMQPGKTVFEYVRGPQC